MCVLAMPSALRWVRYSRCRLRCCQGRFWFQLHGLCVYVGDTWVTSFWMDYSSSLSVKEEPLVGSDSVSGEVESNYRFWGAVSHR